MNYHLIQKPVRPLTRGVVIFWGLPLHRPDLDQAVREALPGWAIVTTPDTLRSVSFQDVAAVRKLTQAPPEATLVLLGFGAGCLSVRAMILSRLTRPWGVGLFNCPLAEPGWKTTIWEPLIEQAAKGQGAFISEQPDLDLDAVPFFLSAFAGGPHG